MGNVGKGGATSSPFFPPDESDKVYGPELPKGLRFGDGPVGSLKEALAVAANGSAEAGLGLVARVEATIPGRSDQGHATTKRTADANATVEAPENLKRLLERQFPDAAQVRLQRAPEPYPEAAPLPPPLPLHPSPVMSAHAVPQIPVEQMPREPLLPAIWPHATGQEERRRLDVRGFLAGFALSGAIGVVVYIYLTAG